MRTVNPKYILYLRQIFGEGFSVIKADGSEVGAEAIKTGGRVWAILNTQIAKSNDLATCSFLHEVPGEGIMKCTAVVRASADSAGWNLLSVQQSAPIPAALVGVPMMMM